MTTATAPRRAKRIAHTTATKTHPRRAAPRPARKSGVVSMVAIGTVLVLGAAAFALAVFEPRTKELLRRGLKEVESAARELPSRLPHVSLPAPSLHGLENVGRQIADAGQRLVRAAADRF
jgi:hypothetical protein